MGKYRHPVDIAPWWDVGITPEGQNGVYLTLQPTTHFELLQLLYQNVR
jgi:hypothetical protein